MPVYNTCGHKNADAFNHTLGYTQEYKVVSTPTYNAIDQAIRKAHKQSGDIVLKVDSDLDLRTLTGAMNDRVCRCTSIASITVIWRNRDVTYKRADIVKNGFKIQKEDFR